MKLFESETQLLKNIQIYFLKMLSHKHFFENFKKQTLLLSPISAKLKVNLPVVFNKNWAPMGML